MEFYFKDFIFSLLYFIHKQKKITTNYAVLTVYYIWSNLK